MTSTVELTRGIPDRADSVLGDRVLEFVAELQREFASPRRHVLAERDARQAAFDAGETPALLPETAHIRHGDWRVPPAPADLVDRRVEITGPTAAKMMVNAFNSGAQVFMADLEDASTPTWHNMLSGQANVFDAVRGRLTAESADGRVYRLGEERATLIVRPRGWHLDEPHLQVDGQPISASLFDAGVFLANNARELLARGSGPYLYLPKLESHHEARLWGEVFRFAEERLDLPTGSIRATVLIETITAAYEMDEILHALGPSATGLNAGRWDYIFSIIKKFRSRPDFVLPDRSQVTMEVPFLRAYAESLVATCHRRGAHAIGGMAAYVPSRRHADANAEAFSRVRQDKEREVRQGFDGTWVAHPDLVPVARAAFDGGRPGGRPPGASAGAWTQGALLDVAVPGGMVTMRGVRNNVAVGLRYLESWLRGTGAAAIFNLMEDVATAEIARAQLWQWLRHRSEVADGPPVTEELVRTVLAEELASLQSESSDRAAGDDRSERAGSLLSELVFAQDFPDFLTTVAYRYLDE